MSGTSRTSGRVNLVAAELATLRRGRLIRPDTHADVELEHSRAPSRSTTSSRERSMRLGSRLTH
jgi:hypothetical protein